MKKVFRRYLLNCIYILALFLLLNCVGAAIFMFVIKNHTVDSEQEIKEIAEGIILDEEGQIIIRDEAKSLLSEKKSWAMILDERGNVIWDYQMPAELPRTYSVSEVVGFAHWYLGDYPVLTQPVSCGLLVVGYEPDSIFGITLVKLYYVTDSGFLSAVIAGAVVLIGVNIFLVVLLFWHNTRKMEKEIAPVLQGIEDISNGRRVELPDKGALADINQKLNYASQYMKKKDRTRAEWINGISHDVRTPLSLIMGYACEMKEDREISAKARKQAAIISAQAEKIKRLVTDLNLTSKLSYSMNPLQMEKVDLLELGRQVLSDFLNNGIDEKYEITYNTGHVGEQILYIEADASLLRRMLENLIQNSISHNPDGCSIALAIFCEEQNCHIVVSDSGRGVSEEKRKQLNDGVTATVDYMPNGEAVHGYGIKLVRQIVEAHQGTITFKESRTGGLCAEIVFHIP